MTDDARALADELIAEALRHERANDLRRPDWTAAELIETTFPAPRFAVPGLIPEGLTFFAGAPKVGKS
jgi:hypothetical protein